MSPLESFFSAPPISRYTFSPLALLLLFRSHPLILTDHRTLAAVTFTFSLLLWTNLFPHDRFTLSLPSLIQLPPELWRLFTPLFITGGGIGILLDTYFCKFCLGDLGRWERWLTRSSIRLWSQARDCFAKIFAAVGLCDLRLFHFWHCLGALYIYPLSSY
jgi:hypothetical protein